jgi:hypothetical protein
VRRGSYAWCQQPTFSCDPLGWEWGDDGGKEGICGCLFIYTAAGPANRGLSCRGRRGCGRPGRDDGVPLNVTAIFTLDQVQSVVDAVKGGAPAYVSVFAGRIADTGADPVLLMAEAVRRLAVAPNARLIWASPRELLNIFQADAIGCHVITVTNDILRKLSLIGKNLADYSLETVQMFYEDGRAAGLAL